MADSPNKPSLTATPGPTVTSTSTPTGTPSPTPSTTPAPTPVPSAQAPYTPPATDRGTPPAQGSRDRVQIDWTSIRELARLFDRTGDDVVALQRASTSLAGTSGLVGGDDQGREFAEWYADGYDSLTDAMRLIADKNFAWARNLRDFDALWDWLEHEIVKSLPEIPDIPDAPIPQAPPREVGA
jgi:hypothetical protein